MYTVYTWSPNDLYFLKVNPPKKGLFQPKQGSFGFRVYKYVYYLPIDAIFLCTWYTLSSAHPGTLPWTLPSFWLQLHPHVLNTLLKTLALATWVLIYSPFPTCASFTCLLHHQLPPISIRKWQSKSWIGETQHMQSKNSNHLSLQSEFHWTGIHQPSPTEQTFWLEEHRSKKLLKNLHAPNIYMSMYKFTILHQC